MTALDFGAWLDGMNISERHRRILGMAVKGVFPFQSLTHNSPSFHTTSAGNWEQYVDELVTAGLIARRGSDQLSITPSGRRTWERLKDSIPMADKITNANSPGTYTGTKWNIRPGGNDHEQYRSAGTPC